jgi:hypothetical protein
MDEPRDDEGKEQKPCEDCEPGEVEYVDEEMAKALAHPLRIAILAALNKRVMSPSASPSALTKSSATSATTSVSSWSTG